MMHSLRQFSRGVNLCVGTYNVNIVISAINYNINFESLDLGSDGNLDLKIVVNKFETNLVLDRNGMVSASYMTDETLTAMLASAFKISPETLFVSSLNLSS